MNPDPNWPGSGSKLVANFIIRIHTVPYLDTAKKSDYPEGCPVPYIPIDSVMIISKI